MVEVVAGTSPYFVRLATTRQPAGEDEAALSPGNVVTLRTGDVAWGETIDGRLEYTARDGSGITFVDDLDDYSFTRPTEADCAAVAAPSGAEEPPSTHPSTGVVGSSGAPEPLPSASAAGQPPASPALPGEPVPAVPVATERATASTARPVAAGGTVTLVGAGFLPGEMVTIALHGTDTVLGTGTAAADGTVRIEVRIPSRTGAGPARVDMFGHRSEVVADVRLQIAGSESSVGDTELVPLVAAATALVVTAAGLVSVGSRQRALRGIQLRRA